jgi:hypothetical protein
MIENAIAKPDPDHIRKRAEKNSKSRGGWLRVGELALS